MTNWVEPWDITTTKWYCTKFKEKDTLTNSISKSWCRTWETFLPSLQKRMFCHIVLQTAPGRLLLSLAAHGSMDNVCTVILLPVGIMVKSKQATLDHKVRSLFLALFTPHHMNREILFNIIFIEYIFIYTCFIARSTRLACRYSCMWFLSPYNSHFLNICMWEFSYIKIFWEKIKCYFSTHICPFYELWVFMIHQWKGNYTYNKPIIIFTIYFSEFCVVNTLHILKER